MTTYIPAKKNTEYIFYAGLVSQSTGQFQSNPTLATGDFKVSIDGGALNNLATLPAVTPASSRMVKFTLSTSEMNGDNITVMGVDAAGSEWDEVIVSIQTAAKQIDDLASQTSVDDLPTNAELAIALGTADDAVLAALATVQADTDNIQSRLPAALSGDGFIKVDLKSIDDELTSGNNATLNLKKLNIVNSDIGDIGVYIEGDTAGVLIYGQFTGLDIESTTNHAIEISTTGSGKNGIHIFSESGKSINAPQDIAVSDGDLTLAAIANAVWTNATRTLTSFGTLVADIWALAIETGYTAKQSMRLMLSALAGKLSGAATTTVTIRDVTDSKNRIIATVDSDGNRTDVTKDVSD